MWHDKSGCTRGYGETHLSFTIFLIFESFWGFIRLFSAQIINFSILCNYLNNTSIRICNVNNKISLIMKDEV